MNIHRWVLLRTPCFLQHAWSPLTPVARQRGPRTGCWHCPAAWWCRRKPPRLRARRPDVFRATCPLAPPGRCCPGGWWSHGPKLTSAQRISKLSIVSLLITTMLQVFTFRFTNSIITRQKRVNTYREKDGSYKMAFSEWIGAVVHLWPVGCSEHVPSSLERMRGVVGDAVFGHVGVLRFILRCAQRRHTVLVEGLDTRHRRHWENKGQETNIRDTPKPF